MHHFISVLILAGHFIAERSLVIADDVTCTEQGQEDIVLDPTCPVRDSPFSCTTRWTIRPCKCDQDCTLYDECCPDFEEMSAAGTLNDWLVYPDEPQILPEKMAWEDDYLPYMSCITIFGVQYGPLENITISASYQFISKCPLGVLEGSTVRNYCENPPRTDDNGDIFSTPIAVEGIGHFRNMYCAVCHGVPFTRFQPWKWFWRGTIYNEEFSSSDDQVEITMPTVDELIKRYCSVIMEPQGDILDDMIPRPCFPRDVKTNCGDETKCPSYLAPVEYDGKTYQNLFCALCNGIDACAIEDQLCLSIESAPSYIVDLPSLANYFGFNSADHLLAATVCSQNEAFNPLTGTCQLLYCFPGFEFNVTTDRCERVPVDDTGSVCLSFYSGLMDVNMTPVDLEYLSAAASNLIMELSLDTLMFTYVVLPAELSCTQAVGRVDECISTPLQMVCQVCFDVELNFTALSTFDIKDDDLGANIFLNETSCLYAPSFGNLSMIDLLIDVPPRWTCESHYSWTFEGYNNVSLRPFRVNITRDEEVYILNVLTLDGVCTNDTRLVCDKYATLEARQFEIETNNLTTSVRIISTNTLMFEDQFQMNPDGSVIYCFQGTPGARNLPNIGFGIITVVGNMLSIISVMIIISTYVVFPQLLNLAGKSVLTLSVSLLVTFLLIFIGEVSAQSETFCKAVAAITHFFWLSIFFWMNALAIDLNRTFGSRAKVRVRSKSQVFYVWYSLYAWGASALIVGACLTIDLCDCTDLQLRYGTDGLCWLSQGDANLYAFGVPLAVLLFLNAILFADTVVGIRLTKKASEKALKEKPALAKAKEELSLYIKLSGVMGFTWMFSFVCEYVNVPELWYIFIAFNSLQGVFILFAFGFNRRNVALWKEKLGIRRDDVTSSSAGDTKSTSDGNTKQEKQKKDQAANKM